MKRFIDHALLDWKGSSIRRPLLLRGARQVGKTYAARTLGKTYKNFVEINLEFDNVARIFQQDLDPKRIIGELSLLVGHPITPEDTLLFIDEIQNEPRAFNSLRYFYEKLPELHIIAAGSLLDFTIEQVGIPVGRVMSLYMYPLSFIEFLEAMGFGYTAHEIFNHPPTQKISEVVHEKLLGLLAQYLAIGGLPEVVKCWSESKDPLQCFKIHQLLINTYRQDFDKYAKKFQLKYLSLLFNRIPLKLGQKFKYGSLGKYRKRELEPCLALLETAGIIHKIFRADGNGIPIGAEADPEDFKVIFLDVGLSQAILHASAADWLLNPLETFINKGELVEAFAGQEILAYLNAAQKADLYYWRKTDKTSQAEVDYLVQKNTHIVPIEVKSGTSWHIKSLRTFLSEKPKTPYGIRLSLDNFSVEKNIQSYPLYAIAALLLTGSDQTALQKFLYPKKNN